MPGKKVPISKKPTTTEIPKSLDDWVSGPESLEEEKTPETQTEKMKRLTLDIPQSLHRAVKRKAIDEGQTMAELLRALLEQNYGPDS